MRVVRADDVVCEPSGSHVGCFPVDDPSSDGRAIVAAGPPAKSQTDRRAAQVAESDVWALALGRVVITFARIEHAATLLIRQCVPEGFGHKAARLDLAARLVYTDRVLWQCGLTNQEEVRWRQVCGSIEELRTQYPAIAVYRVPLPGPIEFTGRSVIVRAARTAQQILLTLEQILLVAERIAAAHGQFVQVSTEILTRLAAEDRVPVSTPPMVPDPA